MLRGIIAGLFLEGLVPHGSILDAGANSGEDSCEYAELQPDRTVHAIDPAVSNVRWMKRQYVPHLPNLRPQCGGLGSQERWIDGSPVASATAGLQAQVVLTSASKSIVNPHTAGAFYVRRVDSLFASAWRRERLAFAHLDVEGMEHDVLISAEATLMRDRPLFTFEARLHFQDGALATKALIEWVHRARYRTFLVEEECGIHADQRNVLAVPVEHVPALRASSIFRLATRHQKLYEATPEGFGKLGHVCCRPGRACCTNQRDCCSWQSVDQRNASHPAEFATSSPVRWGRVYRFGPVEDIVNLRRQAMRSGMSAISNATRTGTLPVMRTRNNEAPFASRDPCERPYEERVRWSPLSRSVDELLPSFVTSALCRVRMLDDHVRG